MSIKKDTNQNGKSTAVATKGKANETAKSTSTKTNAKTDKATIPADKAKQENEKQLKEAVITTLSLAGRAMEAKSQTEAVKFANHAQAESLKVHDLSKKVDTVEAQEKALEVTAKVQEAMKYSQFEGNFLSTAKAEAITEQSGKKVNLSRHIDDIRLKAKLCDQLDFLIEKREEVEALQFSNDPGAPQALRIEDAVGNEFETDKGWVLEISKQVLLTEIDNKIEDTKKAIQS